MGLLVICVEHFYPTLQKEVKSVQVLQALSFLLGLFIGFEMRESMQQYRKCLASLLAYCEEIEALWYDVQLRVESPAARLITDAHMVNWTVSLMRFLLRSNPAAQRRVIERIQPELAGFSLFREDSPYHLLSLDPVIPEVLLLSWLCTLGVTDAAMRSRVRFCRHNLQKLTRTQRVRSPMTSEHLLQLVIHVFLLALPVCSQHMATKITMPLVAVILFVLFFLARELDDPYGLDMHDIPWPVFLSSISQCTICAAGKEVLNETINFFNTGCSSHWDKETAKWLFGPQANVDKDGGRDPWSVGNVDFQVYLTEKKLHSISAIGEGYDEDEELHDGAQYPSSWW